MSLGDKLCEPIDSHVLSPDAIAHVKERYFKTRMSLILKLVTNFVVYWVTEDGLYVVRNNEKRKTPKLFMIKSR